MIQTTGETRAASELSGDFFVLRTRLRVLGDQLQDRNKGGAYTNTPKKVTLRAQR